MARGECDSQANLRRQVLRGPCVLRELHPSLHVEASFPSVLSSTTSQSSRSHPSSTLRCLTHASHHDFTSRTTCIALKLTAQKPPLIASQCVKHSCAKISSRAFHFLACLAASSIAIEAPSIARSAPVDEKRAARRA